VLEYARSGLGIAPYCEIVAAPAALALPLAAAGGARNLGLAHELGFEKRKVALGRVVVSAD
jgi:hypothetical protein